MAKQYVNEYLIDSYWDGDYFYIHKDNFDSSFSINTFPGASANTKLVVNGIIMTVLILLLLKASS